MLIKKRESPIHSRPNPKQQTYSSLKDYRERIDSAGVKTHSFISGMSQDDQYIFKVTSCIYGEALRNVEDPDMLYYIICFGDFFSPKKANKDFHLTRSQTILQGGTMCDFCYHNLKQIPQPEHPNEEFWEKLE